MGSLNKLYYIKIEIENLKKEIKSLPIISAVQYTGMPHGSNTSNPIESYFLKREKLLEKLNAKIEKYTEELIRIEAIIDKIEDIEVRAIARMRFISNMKWEDIGAELGLERTTCSKKLRNYLKKLEI